MNEIRPIIEERSGRDEEEEESSLHGWKREGIGDFGGEWERHFPGEAIEAFDVKEWDESGERNGLGPCCTRMEKDFIEEKLQTPERRFSFQFISSSILNTPPIFTSIV